MKALNGHLWKAPGERAQGRWPMAVGAAAGLGVVRCSWRGRARVRKIQLPGVPRAMSLFENPTGVVYRVLALKLPPFWVSKAKPPIYASETQCPCRCCCEKRGRIRLKVTLTRGALTHGTASLGKLALVEWEFKCSW